MSETTSVLGSVRLDDLCMKPHIEFDGHMWWEGGSGLPWIEMAYRARRGDAIAIEMLTAFKIVVKSGLGQYWPMGVDL